MFVPVFPGVPAAPGMPCQGEDRSIYRRGARRWRKLYKVNGHIFQPKRFNRVSPVFFLDFFSELFQRNLPERMFVFPFFRLDYTSPLPFGLERRSGWRKINYFEPRFCFPTRLSALCNASHHLLLPISSKSKTQPWLHPRFSRIRGGKIRWRAR